MIALLFALLLAGPQTSPDLQSVNEPFEVFAPRETVARWNSFDALPDPIHDRGGIRIDAPPAAVGRPARIDVLQRQGKRWIWRSTFRYERGLTIPPAATEQGVLMRAAGSPFYFWSEVRASNSDAAHLTAFRNLLIEGAPSDATAVLYIPSERIPRTGAAAVPMHFVPAEAVLICATTGKGSRCKDVGAGETRAPLLVTPGGDARVLRVETRKGDEFRVLTRGTLPVRPRVVGTSLAVVSPWVAIGLPPDSVSWADVVIDRSGEESALERIEGSSLAPPPAFAEISLRREHGLVVRPYADSKPVVDPQALLMIFPTEGAGLAGEIPLATTLPGPDGAFHIPTLGTGRYELKLLSSESASQRVAASLVASVPLDIVFPAGPAVRGRIARTGGGSSDDPVTIKISVDAPAQEAMRASDFIDRMRETTAGADGNFRTVLSLPGRYLLRARWRAATAERTFVMDGSDIDLGEIALDVGVALHGEFYPCTDGEAIAVPVPDATRPANFEVLHASVDSNGRFLIAGLSPGRWSVVLRCGGRSMRTQPSIIEVPGAGEMAIRFSLTPK